LERRSRSVRRYDVGIPPRQRRAGDSGCPKGAEEGNDVGMRHKAYALHARSRDRCSYFGGRVLRSVLRPVHVDPHYATWAQAHVGGASESASRLGKPGQLGGTNTGVDSNVRSAARHASPLPARGGRDAEKKRKEVEASVPARTESSGLVARTSIETLQKSVGDVWPRISSANALQKERTGSSERGSSSERRSAGETVGRRVERNARRESTSPVKTGEDRRKAQGGARVPSSGRNIVKSGEAVAGPGL
jgi:hypothetical protein